MAAYDGLILSYTKTYQAKHQAVIPSDAPRLPTRFIGPFFVKLGCLNANVRLDERIGRPLPTLLMPLHHGRSRTKTCRISSADCRQDSMHNLPIGIPCHDGNMSWVSTYHFSHLTWAMYGKRPCWEDCLTHRRIPLSLFYV